MKTPPKGLTRNLDETQFDAKVDEKHEVILALFDAYFGLKEGLTIFLKELSNPLRNWEFIITEARKYSLNHLRLFKKLPHGPRAATQFIDIFHSAIEADVEPEIKIEAVDYLLLFLLRFIKESGTSVEAVMPIINHSFNRIYNYDDERFFLFIKSYYRLNRIVDALLSRRGNTPDQGDTDFKVINTLLWRYYQTTYTYWLNEADPLAWLNEEAEESEETVVLPDEVNTILKPLSHARLHRKNERLNQIWENENIRSAETAANLIHLPVHDQFVRIYKQVPQKLLEAGKNSRQGNQWKLLFLFNIMNIPGLSMIYEETLRDINNTLSWLIGKENHSYIQRLIKETFGIIKLRADQFPETTLNCILNMGKGVYKTADSDLVNYFINCVIDSGFQTPMIEGVGDDWQIKVNNAHIQNIRVWMALIELNPKQSRNLISNLIIYLALTGVFIKDTDLFPRNITRLLNSPIEPVYNTIKQLTRLFPVYYNDIGAEGDLRDISTRIDEICSRKDILIHFFRKRIHVESSNRVIELTEAVLHFWETGDKEPLQPYIPPGFYEQIETDGPYIDGVSAIINFIKAENVSLPGDLLTVSDTKLRRIIDKTPESAATAVEREKVAMFIALYKLLYQKYDLAFTETTHYLAQLKTEVFPHLEELNEALAEQTRPDASTKTKLQKLLNYLALLKDVLQSDETYEIKEDIYKKRHFTTDIPSMFGSYHELKFDALGLTFRIESLINPLFEALREEIDLTLITKATFHKIHNRLRLFYQALKLDGISSTAYERQMDLLTHSLAVRGFTFTQYLDIFKGFTKAVQNIIHDYFHTIHQENLDNLLERLLISQLLEKFRSDENESDPEQFKHWVSEIFFRDRMAFALGLQQLDNFLSKIWNILVEQERHLPKEQLRMLLIYDADRIITPLSPARSWILGALDLGNKGYNLVTLKAHDFPVPPGFIITTETFRYRKLIEKYSPALRNFMEQIRCKLNKLEGETGRVFGDPANPLLVSVRSGSVISQPGMMDTFINVGINEEIAAGIAKRTGNPWLAWDIYRRFLQCYGMAYDMTRDSFDAVIRRYKKKWEIPYKKEFSGAQMQTVALGYRRLIEERGVKIYLKPIDQLTLAIKIVLDSWESTKAKAYRQIMGISDDWGTAVTIQQMVYGNRSQKSGTGVFLTHDPRSPGDQISLWGDFTIGNQGEDVVSGLVNTLPISIAQQDREMRNTDITLESHFPEIYSGLLEWANELVEKRDWSPQEIEFTFENATIDGLYILQSRDLGIRERTNRSVFDPKTKTDDRLLGYGIGVSGGAMSGRIVFTLDEIQRWRDSEPQTKLILTRNDTVPDDIREIHAADGLLTARGGMTSHASIVAYRLDKTCVVGNRQMDCNEIAKKCHFGDITFKSGDYISIDGHEGAVFHGAMAIMK
ncbi:PEP/pyruvate-binding domain-containing protein [Desulfococcaceae bacterium HSG7]|nr:PEP/pyruvate-binding domain-containing protein [Desulfococcaceae bacterium HSG7]